MKIAVSVVIEVDPAEWDSTMTAAEVRGDVKRYVHATLRSAAQVDESEAEVSVR